MRAGLLSDPRVIERINEKFVSTWMLIDDAQDASAVGDKLAKTLAENWDYPLDMMFLTSEGKLINKLNSFKDFKHAHPDVAHKSAHHVGPTHTEVLLKHVANHFGGD